MRKNPRVCVEADEVLGQDYWASVLVFGRYEEVASSPEYTALNQERLLSGNDNLHVVHVMNMHKCKGKQFGGVVLYRAQHSSPFVWPADPQPYRKSCGVLHVAIRRARKHVLILDESSST